jgi:hypothetical protein
VWISGTANVTGIAQPEEVHTIYISDGVLQTLKVPPTSGRWILTADQAPRSQEVAMLSYGYWQRRFGGDPSVIGRNIQIDSQTREIVGVMPRGFAVVNQDFDLLIPLGFRAPEWRGRRGPGNRVLASHVEDALGQQRRRDGARGDLCFA